MEVQSIQPLNVTAATLLIQLLFITLVAIALSSYRSQKLVTQETDVLRGVGQSGSKYLSQGPVLAVAIIGFATLMVSTELYAIWSPIFQGVGINTIGALRAIGAVFVLDFLLMAWLISQTGGSSTSPFVASLFTLPALAIFLRLPPLMFILFTTLAASIYIILLAPIFEKRARGSFPVAFMNLACLALSIFTGYITRPVPIDQLGSSREEVKIIPNTDGVVRPQ